MNRVEDSISDIADQGADALRSVIDRIRGPIPKDLTDPRAAKRQKTHETATAQAKKPVRKKLVEAADKARQTAGTRKAAASSNGRKAAARVQ